MKKEKKCNDFLFKKTFGLPENTPNYMINLETGLPEIYLFSLKLHFYYILKILLLTEERLPKILFKESVKRNVGWFKEWNNLVRERSYVFKLGEESRWGEIGDRLLTRTGDVKGGSQY